MICRHWQVNSRTDNRRDLRTDKIRNRCKTYTMWNQDWSGSMFVDFESNSYSRIYIPTRFNKLTNSLSTKLLPHQLGKKWQTANIDPRNKNDSTLYKRIIDTFFISSFISSFSAFKSSISSQILFISLLVSSSLADAIVWLFSRNDCKNLQIKAIYVFKTFMSIFFRSTKNIYKGYFFPCASPLFQLR